MSKRTEAEDAYRSTLTSRRLYQEDMNSRRAVPGRMIGPCGGLFDPKFYQGSARAHIENAINETDKLLARL